MLRFTRIPRFTVAITGGLIVWLGAVLVVGASAAPDQENPRPTKPPAVSASEAAAPETPATVSGAQAPAAAGYVGEAVCLGCHEDQDKGYGDSAHGRANNPRTPAAKQACETCHGPGEKHVEAGDGTLINNPVDMKPREASAVCVTCHNRSEHSQWAGGKHDARNMSCVTCHSVHAAKSERGQLKTATQQETCVQCHKTQVSKVHRSSHMPVTEGKMECSTCHNPHGSTNVKMLKEGNSINESCSTCHAEKRGPFLWEHAPGRESCVTCHDAHGSNNERMLVAKGPMLCQRCHVHSRHPATIYDNTQLNVGKTNRVVGRACVNCHSQIHGSNHPTSGKYFMR